jgi:GNAT superfamily N-acetyltransferase
VVIEFDKAGYLWNLPKCYVKLQVANRFGCIIGGNSNIKEREKMIKTIEELSMNAWPALQTKLYDGWLLRFAGGYTKRSNSINPIYPSTLSLDEKIIFCEDVYQKLNLPVIFKLTDQSSPKSIDAELEKRSYSRIDETSVRVLEMAAYKYRDPQGLVINNQFNDAWFDGFIHCAGLEYQGFQNSAKNILNSILGEVIVVRKEVGNNIVACGFGAIERDFIGIFDIIVARNHRGKGFGRDIMEGILSHAIYKAIKTAYLSVVVGNVPAENLYQKLGFKEVYKYWYRKK